MESIGRSAYRTPPRAFLIARVGLAIVVLSTQYTGEFDFISGQRQTLVYLVGIADLIVPVLMTVALGMASDHAFRRLVSGCGAVKIVEEVSQPILALRAAGWNPAAAFDRTACVALMYQENS
jgi:hypothetical protein